MAQNITKTHFEISENERFGNDRDVKIVYLTLIILSVLYVGQIGYRAAHGWDFVWDRIGRTGLYQYRVDGNEVDFIKIGIPDPKDLNNVIQITSPTVIELGINPEN